MTGFRNLLMASGGGGVFDVEKSISFNSSDTEYLSRTPANSASSTRKFTMSAWVKRNAAGATFPVFGARSGVNSDDSFGFTSGDKLEFMVDWTNDGWLVSSDTFTSTDWIHVLVAVDTTQATDTNRVKIYLNGTQITSFGGGGGGSSAYPSQNYDFERWQVSGNENTIGRTLSHAPGKANGLMAELVWIDGLALTPSSFTVGTGSDIIPLDILAQSLTFGNHGYYLPFTTAAGLGTDYSGVAGNTTITQKNTYNAGSEINEGDSSANPITAMKFVPIASSTVSKIELNASARGFSGVTVRLETDGGSGTAPSGTLVTNGQVTGITSSGAGMKTATFSTPPEVVAGTTYWIGLRGDTGTWGWQQDVAGSGGALGLYQGGLGYFSGRGAGHNVYQIGNIWTPVNSPTQSTTTPTS